MRYVLNDKDEPVLCEDLMTWARWFENAGDQRKVAETHTSRWWVSTVFLGLDHGTPWDGLGPILYETMVFSRGNFGDLWCERTRTREEALIAHERGVAFAADYFSLWNRLKRAVRSLFRGVSRG